MLDVNVRDVKVKCRKFRNNGLTTGTLKRKNGEIIPISMVIHKLETYLNRNGFNPLMEVNFEGEVINTKIKSTEKHITKHNIVNIDLVEL